MVLSYFSFFLPELSYGFLFSLFIYILSWFFFAPFSRFFFLLYCLLGSFGPKTKNQPSRAFDDKQVKERANVSHIIYVCRPLEVSSASQKRTQTCFFYSISCSVAISRSRLYDKRERERENRGKKKG
jgi:hypothetical protein